MRNEGENEVKSVANSQAKGKKKKKVAPLLERRGGLVCLEGETTRRVADVELCHRGNGGDGGGGGGGDRDATNVNFGGHLAVGVLPRAVTGDVTSLTASIAGLARRVQGAAVGRGAVAGNMAQLATGVALHGLGLAVTGEVVGAAALVAGGRTGAASEPTASSEAASEAATSHGSAHWGDTAAHGTRASARARANGNGVWAGASKMAGLAAVVASTASGVTAQPQGWAVGLDMTETLTMVALLGLGGAR